MSASGKFKLTDEIRQAINNTELNDKGCIVIEDVLSNLHYRDLIENGLVSIEDVFKGYFCGRITSFLNSNDFYSVAAGEYYSIFGENAELIRIIMRNAQADKDKAKATFNKRWKSLDAEMQGQMYMEFVNDVDFADYKEA